MSTTETAKPAPSPPSIDAASISIPEHQLIRRIGAGASGQVWLASNAFGVYRAVKIIHYKDTGRHKLYLSEFAAVAKFEPISRLHDGLVDVLQVGENANGHYFYYVMELADDVTHGQIVHPATYVARTLATDIANGGRLPVRQCMLYGAIIASALGFLHRRKLIHRDLKPSNIIFINGFPKLADVGLLTAISDEHAYVGTEGFIAPEGAGTAAADIYSCGKILYEMSTGNRVAQFPALPADLETAKDSLEIGQFSKVINNACRTNPRARYRNTDDLMAALLSFKVDRSLSRWTAGGRPGAWLIGAIGIVTAILFLLFGIWRVYRLLHQNP